MGSKKEDPGLEAVLADLKAQYDQTRPEKIERVQAAVERAVAQPNAETLIELKNTIHKIGGTAGSYGYSDITSLCRGMEKEIVESVESGSIDPSKWRAPLETFLLRFKSGFDT